MFGLNWKLIGGIILAALIAILGTGGWAYYKGRSDGTAVVTAKYERIIAEANAASLAEIQRRQREYDALVSRHSAEAQRQFVIEQELRNKVKDYEKTLADRPECRLDDSDIDRLR